MCVECACIGVCLNKDMIVIEKVFIGSCRVCLNKDMIVIEKVLVGCL